jgi:diaminopimelate epimerase
LTIATRGGCRQVRVQPGGDISADMGAPQVLGPGHVRLDERVYHGLRVSVGNPHLACLVETAPEEIDLSAAPDLDPVQFPAGANVELVRVTGRAAVRMRVRERGSGETRSCGTGAVAAAVAAAYAGYGGSGAAAVAANGEPPAAATRAGWGGVDSGAWRVAVPGGELTVTLDGRTSWLTGSAVIVADGELRGAWLAAVQGGQRGPVIR